MSNHPLTVGKGTPNLYIPPVRMGYMWETHPYTAGGSPHASNDGNSNKKPRAG